MGSSDTFINVTIEVSCNLVTDCTVYVCADYIMRRAYIHWQWIQSFSSMSLIWSKR